LTSHSRKNYRHAAALFPNYILNIPGISSYKSHIRYLLSGCVSCTYQTITFNRRHQTLLIETKVVPFMKAASLTKNLPRFSGSLCMVTLCMVGLPLNSLAQLPAPLEIRAQQGVTDAGGNILTGSNPNAATFGLPHVPGCLVQIIHAGTDGRANWPGTDGGVTGDDTLVYTTTIGSGVVPTETQSGRLDVSFSPPPALGAQLFARIFNASELSGATHWGQSAIFTVQAQTSIDLSAFGLVAATIPLSESSAGNDSDGDGVTDAQELAANTNASDANDLPLVSRVAYIEEPGSLVNDSIDENADPNDIPEIIIGQDVIVEIEGKIGRRYILQRSTDFPLPGTWTAITDSGVLTQSRTLQLLDETPPSTGKAMYRVKILQP
jgi:hypothetical protein